MLLFYHKDFTDLQTRVNTQSHTRAYVPTCRGVLKLHEKGSKPSEPMMKWWMSGPVDMRGPWQLFSMTPRGVTIFMWTTCSQKRATQQTLFNNNMQTVVSFSFTALQMLTKNIMWILPYVQHVSELVLWPIPFRVKCEVQLLLIISFLMTAQ